MRYGKNVHSLSFIVYSLVFFFFFIFAGHVAAAENSFVTIINPVRGGEFWQTANQDPASGVKASYDTVSQRQLPATWLLRFDALNNPQVVALTKTFNSRQELGAFFEVTPSLAQAAGVTYNKSDSWHYLQSVLLIGYSPQDRPKLIDAYFAKFQEVYGYTPVSVGAWWIDANSLKYMQEKYGVTGSLIVADQYSTDNYQIWGQYWSSPYYPATYNTLQPAKDTNQKIPVVITQWAARDPYNAYGNGVYESTYSVQANDYLPFHKLSLDYFSKLVDIYTKPINNQFGQIVVGIENDYPVSDFGAEYRKQIEILDQKARAGQFRVVTQRDFSTWYKLTYPDVSPPRVIAADDPLGTGGKVAWFQNTHYRVGWFFIPDKGSIIRDLRPYVEGAKEPCLEAACTSLNFATGATRVLDEVTFGINALITQGNINNFKQNLSQQEYQLSYQAASGKEAKLRFAPHDLYVDDQGKTIDTFILAVQEENKNRPQIGPVLSAPQNNWAGFIFSTITFLFALIFVLYLPARLLTRKALNHLSVLEQTVITLVGGIVLTTLVVFLAGFMRAAWLVIPLYIVAGIVHLIYTDRQKLSLRTMPRFSINLPLSGLIGVLTVLQLLPIIKSGWQNQYGVTFFGPNGHDALWHIALIEQLRRNVPPENPIFAGTPLTNYHYFYDLFAAIMAKVTMASSFDIYFRLLPILLSVLFGLLIYILVKRLTDNRLAPYLAITFAYLAGSFGYVVSYLKGQGLFAGESAFWANQAISFHLNEPFAISAVILLSFLFLLRVFSKEKLFIALLVLLGGTVIEFKVYAGLLLLGALFVAAFYDAAFYRRFTLGIVTLLSALVSLVVFLPINAGAASLVVIAPMWLIHDMVNAPDRVGWQKLADARLAYFERHEWLKYVGTEILGLAIFWLGNLGARLLGLIGGLVIVMQKLRSKSVTSFDVLVISFIAASFIIPTLIAQEATGWNTVQFMYYGLLLLSIYTGITLAVIAKRFNSQVITTGLVALSVLLAIPTTIGTLKDYVPSRPPTALPHGEKAALDALRSEPYGVVLTYPYDERLRKNFEEPVPLFSYVSTAYVSAFSSKPVYLEDEINNGIIGVDYTQRLAQEKEFFQGRDSSFIRSFLKNNKITYVYVPRYLKDHLDEGTYGIKKIYESDTVNVYRVAE